MNPSQRTTDKKGEPAAAHSPVPQPVRPRQWSLAIVGGETHIKEITSLHGNGLEIVGAVVREDQIAWARQSLQTEVYTEMKDLMAAQSPRIVVAANENYRKAEVIKRALASGCHVIADKPAAINLTELDEMEQMAKDYQRRFLMLLTLRGHAHYRKLRELVASGAIGEPVQCQAKMSVELKPHARPPWFLDQRLSGGPILDLAIHSIDAVEWITGLRLASVTSYQANISRPQMTQLVDSGACLFRLENGGTAFIQFNRVLPAGCGNDYRLDVVGTEGQIEFRLGRYLRLQKKGNAIEDFPLAKLSPNQSVVADWLKSLDDRDHSPLVPDAASFRANRIACLAQNSADSGKTVAIHD